MCIWNPPKDREILRTGTLAHFDVKVLYNSGNILDMLINLMLRRACGLNLCTEMCGIVSVLLH